jgi:SAM-dependent methyltransferase
MQNHWETVYTTKNQVSWFEESPFSIELITSVLDHGSVIDIGSGASKLVDGLILKYQITCIDISSSAIQKVRDRVGEKANFIVGNVLDVDLVQADCWHDRAVFHFLTTEKDKQRYINQVNKYTKQYVIIGTFALDGPEKCSGLSVCRYDADGLARLFANFKLVRSLNQMHKTPWGSLQSFTFVILERSK